MIIQEIKRRRELEESNKLETCWKELFQMYQSQYKKISSILLKMRIEYF